MRVTLVVIALALTAAACSKPQTDQTRHDLSDTGKDLSGVASQAAHAQFSPRHTCSAVTKRKAVQYVVGNPLFALQMTQHDIRASLYAPLRVLLYEDERGRTCLEYDKPSSLFGQFNDDRIASVASMLDRKLEDLVAAVVE